ncbi:MAG: hypothetical protein KIT87_07545 [Anaerolineae bacterium]|nr:hypothetical protein [Anaerolineae bacterium]
MFSSKYSKLLLVLVTIALCAVGAPRAQAQGNPAAIKVTSTTASAKFAQEIKFEVKAESSAGDIQRIDLYYTFHDDKASNRVPTEITPAKSVTATATKRAQQGEFAPQLDIRYYWRITDSAGNTLKTDTQTVVYSDDRYQWQKVANDRATVFWYSGNANTGQQFLQWTMEGLDRLEKNFGIKMSYPIHVVLYANKNDMALALSPRGDVFDQGATVLGEARSAYGTLLMLNQADAKTTLWHELTHLVLHDLVKGPYESNLVSWLDEGLAMYNEADDHNDNYQRALTDAIRRNDVFVVRSMTSPNGVPAKVGIWYGQARSVVEYLLTNQGGKDKLAQLLNLLAGGTRVDPALKQVYNFDQDQLNDLWRASVGLPTQSAPVQPAQAATATPRSAPAGPTAAPRPPTNTPRPPESSAQPPASQGQAQPAPQQPAPAPAPVQSSGLSNTTLLILGGLGLIAACSTVLLTGLVVLGAVLFTRRRA